MKSRILKLIDLTAVAIESISGTVQKELAELKRKVKQLVVIFTLLFVGFLSFILGLGFFLESKIKELENGLGFILIGLILFAMTFIYFLTIKK